MNFNWRRNATRFLLKGNLLVVHGSCKPFKVNGVAAYFNLKFSKQKEVQRMNFAISPPCSFLCNAVTVTASSRRSFRRNVNFGSAPQKTFRSSSPTELELDSAANPTI